MSRSTRRTRVRAPRPADGAPVENFQDLAGGVDVGLQLRLAEFDHPLVMFEALFASTPAPYLVFTADGRPLLNNRAYREMFGTDGSPAYDAFADGVAASVGLTAALSRALHGETVELPTLWIGPNPGEPLESSPVVDGAALPPWRFSREGTPPQRRAVSCTCFPIRTAEARVTHVGVLFRDVTSECEPREPSHAEASEARLRDTLEAAHLGTWEWDIAANRMEWSPPTLALYNSTNQYFSGTYEAWLALVHPHDRDRVASTVSATLRDGAPCEVEFRHVTVDGKTCWRRATGSLVRGADDQPRLLRGVVADVTARRAAERALDMPARVLESMSEGVSLSDEDGYILYTNPAEDHIFGYERGELIGKHVTIQVENEPIVAAVIAQLKERGEWSGERSNRRKDGTRFTTRARITTLELDGRLHYLCVQQDATAEIEARREAERLGEALRASEARYRTFVGQSTDGIWRFEVEAPVPVTTSVETQIDHLFHNGYLAECNDSMARMYGFERAEQLIGKRFGELLVRDEPRNVEYLRAFVEGGYRLQNVESYEIDRDGNRRVFQNSLVGVIESGRLVRTWGTQRDVTADVEVREQARAANRAKDEFLAMLGHELRNPLSPILTALELMKLRGSDMLLRERTIIARQVEHLVRLVDDLLDVSRITRGKISLEKRPSDVADVVAVALELASPLLEARSHRLHVHVPRGLVVDGDPTRLSQVFTNLLTNAAKYTPPGGTVAILGVPAGEVVRITVRDSGIGIRPEILPRVFDAFVQERQPLDRSQGGLGLGLAIVKALVGLHGGTVGAYSEGNGRGSEFFVELPLGRDPAADPVPAPLPRPGGPCRQILLVDDNEDAAELLGQALSALGHTVRVVHDAPAALAMLERFVPEVALLDIGLPVMDGYELARRVRARPGLARIRLVAVTGYGQPGDRAAAQAAGFDELLVKPVNLGLLEKAIETTER